MQGSGTIVTSRSEGNNTFTATNPEGPSVQTLRYVGDIWSLWAHLEGWVRAEWNGYPDSVNLQRADTISGFDRFEAHVNGFIGVTGTDRAEAIVVRSELLYWMELFGGGGNDTIKVNYDIAESNQLPQLFGGDGNDLLIGGRGGDVLYGEDGNDTIVCGDFGIPAGKAANNVAYGGSGGDLIFGGNDDSAYLSNELYGDSGNDTIQGGNLEDFIYGDEGDDRLFGGNGDDYFYLDAGADQVFGGVDGITLSSVKFQF